LVFWSLLDKTWVDLRVSDHMSVQWKHSLINFERHLVGVFPDEDVSRKLTVQLVNQMSAFCVFGAAKLLKTF
jgi:hypothetical protein